MSDERTRIADHGLGGVHEHCAGFSRAIKFRVSCLGEFEICPIALNAEHKNSTWNSQNIYFEVSFKPDFKTRSQV